MRTCAQKVPLVKKWVNYMPRKIGNSLFCFDSYRLLTKALELGREMKLCDLMNIVTSCLKVYVNNTFLGTNLELYIKRGHVCACN